MMRSKASKTEVALVTAGLVVVAMITTMLLYPVFPAYSAMQSTASSVSDEIVAVHNSSAFTEITVLPSEGNSDFVMNILVAPNDNITMCGKGEFAKDLNPGEKATIQYHELSGLAIGDRIAEQC